MSDEINRNETTTGGNGTSRAEGFGETSNISELGITMEDIDVFSDVNMLLEDDEETQISYENVSEEGSTEKASANLVEFGIEINQLTENDITNALVRLTYCLGDRELITGNSYNKKTKEKVDLSNTNTRADKEKASLAQELQMYKQILMEAIDEIIISGKSSHTDVNSEHIKNELLDSIKNVDNCFQTEQLNNEVFSTIRELYSEKGVVNSDEVFDKLILDYPAKAMNYYANREDCMSLISSLSNIYINYMKEILRLEQKNASADESMRTIFKKDIQNIEQLLQENKNNNLTYVKQIVKVDGDFFIKCSCSNYFKINTISRLLVYGKQENAKVDYFPTGLKCPYCGKVHMFTEIDLAELILHFKSEYREILCRFVQNALKNCNTLSFARYNVAIEKLTSFLPSDMFIEKQYVDLGIEHTKTEDEKDTKSKVTLAGDGVYMKAIEEFYKQLNSLTKDTIQLQDGVFNVRCDNKIIQTFKGLGDDSKNLTSELETHLNVLKKYSNARTFTTYGIMAAFVANRENINYHNTKNQAIFSLLLSIQGNPAIKAYTSIGDLSELYANYSNLKECLSFSNKAFPLGYKTILMSILARYDIEIDMEDSTVSVEVWDNAKKLLKTLEDRIKDRLECIEELKNLLYDMEEVLIFTKIVNVNSLQMHELVFFLEDKRFAEFCDRVADRMIITNYSENVVSWRPYTANALQRVQDNITFEKVCRTFLSSGLSDYVNMTTQESFSKNVDRTLDKYYRLTKDTSFLNLAITGDIYDALKKCNYVKAVQLCKNARIGVSQLSDKCGAMLQNSWKNVETFYERNLDMCSLSEDVFYLIVAGFQAEDLDASSTYKFSLKKIPKRRGQETLKEYNNRIEAGDCEDTINSFEFFESILKDLITIMLVSNTYKFGMKSFINAAFMISTFDLIVNTMNYVNVCELFRLSSVSYELISGQVYESNLWFKHGRWYPALDSYVGNDEISAALNLKMKDFDESLHLSVSDTIDLENIVDTNLNSLHNKLLQLQESNKPLVVSSVSNTEGASEVVDGFDPFNIMCYVKEFLEVQ